MGFVLLIAAQVLGAWLIISGYTTGGIALAELIDTSILTALIHGRIQKAKDRKEKAEPKGVSVKADKSSRT